MKHARSEPPKKFRIVHLDPKLASYTLWFACKNLNRKLKKVFGTSKAGNGWLPQELVDCIVDYVSDDRATLLACTHLSRTWCIAARAHLHRTFTVSDSAGFGAIDDLQRMGMIHLVRRMITTRNINQADFLLPATMTRLHAFTHLQELDIRYLDVGQPLLWLHEHCDILKSTIRTLTLRYPRGSIKQLASLISLFSNLENLTIDSIDKAVVYDSEVPVIQSSPPLTGRLTLTGIFDPEFICALASMPKGVQFRTVDLQFCGEVQEIVDACAGTMERLIYHPSDSRDLKDLDLSRCDSLRHVEVGFHSVVRAFPDFPIYDFISTVPSSQLETCLIVGYDNDLEELRRLLWMAPERKSRSATTKGKPQPKRDVKVTFGLDIEKEEAEEHHKSTEEALYCAAANGVFGFLNSIPTLEVYPRVWYPTA